MCFIRIDIFTQSLWLMKKHQLQNNNITTKRRVLATSAQNKWSLGSGHFQFYSSHTVNGNCQLILPSKNVWFQSFLWANRQIFCHVQNLFIIAVCLFVFPFMYRLNWKCIGPSPEKNMIPLMSQSNVQCRLQKSNQ